MQLPATTTSEYLQSLPDDQRLHVTKLHQTILDHLPKGFEACINYGMIGYVVPHSLYPAGYHCDPKLPLPFMGLAGQKNSISFYHMGIYLDHELLTRYQTEYAKQVPTKLDMGKSCTRRKKYGQIPYNLIGDLVGKMSVDQWIMLYEKNLKR
jgi:hypothetical protein